MVEDITNPPGTEFGHSPNPTKSEPDPDPDHDPPPKSMLLLGLLIGDTLLVKSMVNLPPFLMLMEELATVPVVAVVVLGRSSNRCESMSELPCSSQASRRPHGLQVPCSGRMMSHAPGLDRLTRSDPGDGTKGVTIDAAATGEPERSWMVTDHPFLSFECESLSLPTRDGIQLRDVLVSDKDDLDRKLRSPTLFRKLKLQVKTGCFTLPWTWNTWGLHSGSFSNSNTNLGSGSALTLTYSFSPLFLPMSTHPLWTDAARASARLKSSGTDTFPISFEPPTSPQAPPKRPRWTSILRVGFWRASFSRRGLGRLKQAARGWEEGWGSGERSGGEVRGREACWGGRLASLTLQKKEEEEGWTVVEKEEEEEEEGAAEEEEEEEG